MLFIALSPPISLHIFYYSLIISEIQQTLHIITKIRYPLYIPLIICENIQKRGIFAMSIVRYDS